MACHWGPAHLCWRWSMPRGAPRRWAGSLVWCGVQQQGRAACTSTCTPAHLTRPNPPRRLPRTLPPAPKLATKQVVGKPEASFFQLALGDAGCQPQDAVMIGERSHWAGMAHLLGQQVYAAAIGRHAC